MAARYDPNVLSQALATAHRLGATSRETKALIEAGIVESGLRQLRGGDRDSTGFLQQRPSQGWGPVGESVATDTAQFLRAARKLTRGGFKGSAGSLAQAVQRSAFPARYDAVAGQATGLLGRPPAGVSGPTRGASAMTPATADSLPGTETNLSALLAAAQQSQQRPVIQSAGLQAPAFAAHAVTPQGYATPPGGGGPAPAPDVSPLLAAIAGATPFDTSAASPGNPGSPGTPGTPGSSGTAAVGGAGFAKSHSPLLELIHKSGNGGFAVKNGQKVSGPGVFGAVWDGHADHVHVAAGPKTVVALGQLAQKLGLHVGENPHFGGVSPVHVPGSYHYRGEAIDVSGNPKAMNRYAAEVERLYGVR